MADVLQGLRSEYADIVKRVTRVAILTLTILTIAVVAYTKAFAKISEADVRGRLAYIQALVVKTNSTPVVSYVFEWSLPRTESEPSFPQVLDQPPTSYSGDQAKLVAEADRLERDAATWFTVRLSLLGSSIEGDLRYWILFLPLFLVCANFYLAVTSEKARVIERIANAHVRPAMEASQPANPLDQLLFSEVESSYTRYPRRFGNIAYVLATMVLVVYLVVISRVVWREWEPDLIRSMAWATLILISWVAVVVCWIKEKLWAQAEGIISVVRPASRGVQLHRWVMTVLQRLREAAKNLPRVVLSSGLLLVGSSLFLPLAKCADDKYTGVEVLRTNQRAWFLNPTSYGDLYLSRYIYAATVAFGLLAFLALLIAFRRGGAGRYANLIAPVGWVFAWYALIDAAFAYSVAGIIFAGDIIRGLLFFAPLGVWIRWPRMRREASIRRRERLFSLLIAVYLPALILGPVSLTELAVRGVPGYDGFFFGTVLLAFGLDALRRTSATVAPAAPLPADPSAHPA